MRSSNTIYILYLLISICIWSGCQEEDGVYGNDSYAVLDGKLKHVLSVSENQAKENTYVVSEYIYDEEGKLIKVIQPHPSEDIHTPLSYQLYTYNESGLLYKVTEYDANLSSESGFLNLRNIYYYYEAEDRLIKELTEYPEIRSFEYYLYSYSNERIDRITKYNQEDSVTNSIRYLYDRDGLLIKEIYYDQEDRIIQYTVHQYENGLNIQSDTFTADDIHIRGIIKAYNEEGLLIIIESNELSPASSAGNYILKIRILLKCVDKINMYEEKQPGEILLPLFLSFLYYYFSFIHIRQFLIGNS